MASVYLWYRGHKMSAQVKGALLAAEQRAGRTFAITQGGFNGTRVAASAGTHAGDALDLSVRGLSESQVSKMIEAMRWAGFAAWFRTTSIAKWGTRAQGFNSYHVHAVPNGWGYPSAGARAQAVAYRAGRDGLSRNLRDLGPGHVSTWRKQTTPRVPIETTPKPAPRRAKAETIEQMAREVLDGLHGIGHDNRRASLGVGEATYQKVADAVNRILAGQPLPASYTTNQTDLERLLSAMTKTELQSLIRSAVRAELDAERNRRFAEYPAAGVSSERPKSTLSHVIFSIQRDLRDLAAKLG